MITLGYKLSSEEQSATDLVRYAQMAQDTGFGFALISDHFDHWTDRQGQSPSCGVCWAPTLRPRSA
jgi:coenzyme F420-dependent glucose-6-phosphate dehydrogenase